MSKAQVGLGVDGDSSKETSFAFEEIVNLPHFHLAGKKYLTNRERAAQFASYKSLAGYEEMIERQAEEILNASEREIIYDFDDSGHDLDLFPEDGDGDETDAGR